MTSNIYQPFSEEDFVYNEGLLMQHLYQCWLQKLDPVIDFIVEGPCAEYNGLYRLLDSFCDTTGFDPSRILLRTGNMIENHPRYRVEIVPDYWYEVTEIQNWIKKQNIATGLSPKYHFCNFTGRSTWYRLWIATILNSYHATKTLQTFNSGIRSNYVVKEHTVDRLGLEDLVRNECDIIPQVAAFLDSCPKIIPEEIDQIKHIKPYIQQIEHYPIQHPANLNILKYYSDIFVDIVCETKVLGNVFFVSEKTWRCIIARRPFIVVGGQFFLTNLKKLGFKTFDKWWDEGYDDYAPQQRIKEIEKILEKISSWPLSRLQQTLLEMQQTLDHNYQVFQNLTYDQINQVFCHD
jgi:hypothetical protein